MTFLLPLILAVSAPAEPLLRLLEPPFTREDCERHILSPRGESWRQRTITWLATWRDLPLMPITSHRPLVDPELHSPEYAVFRAPRDVGARELQMLKAEADQRHLEWRHLTATAPPVDPAKPLTPLHEMILGVHSPVDVPSDELETTLDARGHDVMILRTRHGANVIGERELDLAGLRLAYEGDPYFWMFEMHKARAAGDDPPRLTPNGFLTERGVYVLRPREDTRPAIYFVLRVFNGPGGRREIESIELEAYTARPAHPAGVEDFELRVPPVLDADERASKFTPLGLKLLLTLD